MRICLFFMIFITACNAPQIMESTQKTSENLTLHYTNILDYTGTPNKPTDRSVYMFADLGAWHGYALPERDLVGSFIGPFTMTMKNGVWLSESLAQFSMLHASTGKMIPLSHSSDIIIQSFPNKLHQSFQLPDAGIKMNADLIFISSRTALMKYTLEQIGSASSDPIQLVWSGNAFGNQVHFSKEQQSIKLSFPEIDDTGAIVFSGASFEALLTDSSYVMKSAPIQLKKGEKKEIIMSQSLCFSPKELEEQRSNIKHGHAFSETYFSENEVRWNDKIHGILSKLKPEFQDESDQRVAIKCLQTLNNNWRSPAGFLKHDGLFPSYSYEWFHGFWAWDSWKHAVAIALYDPTLAQDQIRAMYDFQDEYGMIADCVYRDTIIEHHNWRNTKPPLSGWSMVRVFEVSQDTSFLKEMLPMLEKYHQWWYQYRDHDQNGLCEYGSTDGSLIAAKWESGMDNAVRFDSTTIVKNRDGAWSITQESVDLNAYLCFEKTQLSKIHKILGNTSKATTYHEEAKTLKSRIQEHFFNDSLSWFFDVALQEKTHITTAGAEGWIPLFTQIATAQQANEMMSTLLDTNKFATYVPLPILSADHPKFKPDGGYWRGPVWLDHSYFAIQSLLIYGFEKEAKKLSAQTIDHLQGLKDSSEPIYENYHPLTGAGLESKHFSWSAAHLLLLMVNDDTE